MKTVGIYVLLARMVSTGSKVLKMSLVNARIVMRRCLDVRDVIQLLVVFDVRME